MNRIGFYISSLLLVLLIVSSTVFVVDQRQYGVVYSLGQIKKVITEPGLNFKLPPPFQNVNFIDKRLLTLDNVDSEPMLTAEKQRMVIDWYVRWRISDPSQYIRNVGLDFKIEDRVLIFFNPQIWERLESDAECTLAQHSCESMRDLLFTGRGKRDKAVTGVR